MSCSRFKRSATSMNPLPNKLTCIDYRLPFCACTCPASMSAQPIKPCLHSQIDKLPREQVEKELTALGVSPDTVEGALVRFCCEPGGPVRSGSALSQSALLSWQCGVQEGTCWRPCIVALFALPCCLPNLRCCSQDTQRPDAPGTLFIMPLGACTLARGMPSLAAHLAADTAVKLVTLLCRCREACDTVVNLVALS